MMAKFTFSLAVVVLAAFLDVGLSDIDHWNRSGGGRPGFGQIGSNEGKCSAMKGILPDAKSGCCGRHAGTDGGNPGGDDSGIGGGDEKEDTGNDNDYGNDDDNDGYGPGSRDDGNGPGVGPGRRDGFPDWDMGNGIGGGMDDIDFDDIFGGRTWPFNKEYRIKRSASKNASDTVPDKFITAGKATGIAQYPWLVHLTVKIQEMFESKMIACGGSLISSRHVITAAHCLDFEIRNHNDVSVYLAEYNTRSFPTDCVGRQCIKNVVMHPNKLQIHSGYQRGMLYNDIGMMRLAGTAPYTDYIRPICLPPFNINTQNPGTTLTITGWGQTERGQPSSIKLHTQVQLVAPNTCRRHYPELTEGQLCAAGKSGQDTCMGDSGGPIMVERDGNFYLVGLVSGKRSDAGCGSSTPTLYTNVFAYTKWIQNFMRN